ncbi:MAG TPA: hypothetical protein VFO16_01670, partial [Pseudonocardiaceae bacterium]|nr:hypothetical protein [Pseudonocardiaceae bacterium]
MGDGAGDERFELFDRFVGHPARADAQRFAEAFPADDRRGAVFVIRRPQACSQLGSLGAYTVHRSHHERRYRPAHASKDLRLISHHPASPPATIPAVVTSDTHTHQCHQAMTATMVRLVRQCV